MTARSSASKPTILVSIINYGTPDLTIRCAQSVLDDIGEMPVHIAIVDNASRDGSVERLQDWIGALPLPCPVTLVRSAKNTGFSGGHNQGIATAQADHYLLLNSDTILKPGFLRAILDAAAHAPQAGLIAPRIEYEDGIQQISCFRFHGFASEFIRGASSGPVTQALHRYEVALSMPPESSQIAWASFACILLRHEVVEDVGPMDSGYFLYFEDVAYCWKARQMGWRISYAPEARLVHFRGGSGPVKSLEQEKKRLPPYFYASRTRMFRQFYGPLGPTLANLAWLAGRGVAYTRKIFRKTVPRTAQFEAYDIWTNVLTPLGNSRAPQDET